MKFAEKIQGLLPLGYLYLMLLGLLKESILFNRLGINILNYSSITDILLSPISDMSSNPILIVALGIIILLLFIFQTILIKNSHKDWAKKILGKERFSADVPKSEIRKTILPVFILIIAFELLFFFVGIGLGEGVKISKKIEQDKLEYNNTVEFSSGKMETIYIIDLNSTYFFYLKKGNKNINIAPIGTINNLEVIKTQKDDEK